MDKLGLLFLGDLEMAPIRLEETEADVRDHVFFDMQEVLVVRSLGQLLDESNTFLKLVFKSLTVATSFDFLDCLNLVKLFDGAEAREVNLGCFKLCELCLGLIPFGSKELLGAAVLRALGLVVRLVLVPVALSPAVLFFRNH